MKQSIKLDLKEITAVLINVISVKLFFTFPKRLVVNSGSAAWLQILYVFAVMLVIFALTTIAYKRCGNTSIIQMAEGIGGKPLKMTVGVLVSVALFFNLAATMRSFPDIVKMVLLPNTPMEAILIIFAFVVALAAWFGIESISRIHSVFVPIVLGIMVAFFIFLIPHTKISNIMPIFGRGTYNVFVKGIESIDFFDDIIILNLLLPYIKNTKEAEKAGYRAIIVSSVAACLILLIYCLIYPYPSSQKFIIPIYQLTRLVEIGTFFQRFEAFFEFIWSLSIFLYSALYLAIMCEVWRDCFDLKYEKPLIVPIIAITTILSLSSQRMHEVVFNYWYLTIFTIVIAFVFPIVFPIIYKKKKKL